MSGAHNNIAGTSAAVSSLPVSAPVSVFGFFLLVLLSLLAILGLLLLQI